MFTASGIRYENWYDRPLAPSVLRRINPAEGQKEYFQLPKVGTDVVEFSIKSENNVRGTNPPWKDQDLRQWSAVTNDKKMVILRKLFEEANMTNPQSRMEIEKVQKARLDVTDRHMAVLPTRVGDIIVKDALMDTGATLTAITLKLLWALMGRCSKIKRRLECAYWLDEDDRSGDIIAAGGERVRVYGYVMLPMSIGNVEEIDIPAAVYEDDACALILGTPALRKLGFVLTAPAALGIDLIEPPANYEAEFAKLRDTMVERIHREQGDKKYLDSEKVERNEKIDNDDVEELSFRNSSILVAKGSGKVIEYKYGNNKYGYTDSLFTEDSDDDSGEGTTDANFRTAFDHTVAQSTFQPRFDQTNDESKFPVRKTSTPKSPNNNQLPTPEMSAIEKPTAKQGETPRRPDTANENLRKRAIANTQHQFEEKALEQGQAENFQRLFEAIRQQSVKTEQQQEAIQSKLTQMSEANLAIVQRIDALEHHFHLTDVEDSSLRSATSGQDQSKQADQTNDLKDQSMMTQHSASIEVGQEGLSLLKEQGSANMSMMNANLPTEPTERTNENSSGAPDAQVENSGDVEMETSPKTTSH